VDDVTVGSSYLIESFSGRGAVSGMVLCGQGSAGEAQGRREALGVVFKVVHAQTIF
jgi:hypothetical protein